MCIAKSSVRIVLFLAVFIVLPIIIIAQDSTKIRAYEITDSVVAAQSNPAPNHQRLIDSLAYEIEEKYARISDSAIVSEREIYLAVIQQLEDSLTNFKNLPVQETVIVDTMVFVNTIKQLKDSLTTVSALTPDTAVVIKNDTLTVVKRDTVIQQILVEADAIVDTVYEPKVFKYLQRMMTENQKQLDLMFGMAKDQEAVLPFQMDEFDRYFKTYFPEYHSDLIQVYLIQVNRRNSIWPQTLAQTIKFVCLYPESMYKSVVTDSLALIFNTEDYYENYREEIFLFLNEEQPDISLEERYFKYINWLNESKLQEVRDLFTKEAAGFLYFFPETRHATLIYQIMAEHYLEKEKAHSAFITLYKMRTLCPEDSITINALFEMAEIQRTKFEEYNDCVDGYNDFRQQYPEHEIALKALYTIAEVYHHKTENFERAVETYQAFADQYPDDKKAVKALFKKAEILSDKMNLVEQSVATYNQIFDKYPGPTNGHKAIFLAGDLYEDAQKYESAAELYTKIVDTDPKSPESLKALKKMESIYDSKLNDTEKTIEVLNLIIANHPETKDAKKAQKTLAKMEKE